MGILGYDDLIEHEGKMVKVVSVGGIPFVGSLQFYIGDAGFLNGWYLDMNSHRDSPERKLLGPLYREDNIEIL